MREGGKEVERREEWKGGREGGREGDSQTERQTETEE